MTDWKAGFDLRYAPNCDKLQNGLDIQFIPKNTVQN